MHRIAISLGDPLGVGPEIVAHSLADSELRSRAAWVLVGDEGTAREQLAAQGIACTSHENSPSSPGDVLFVPVIATSFSRGGSADGPRARVACAWAGDVSYRAVEAAIQLVQQGDCGALVTAPINKTAWALAGHTKYPGHTELLAAKFASPNAAMMFHAAPDARSKSPAGLHVILATVHLPLSRVASALSTDRIVQVAQLGATEMQRLGVAAPRVALCGLNPHAGEGGLLGEEDERIIAPAAAQLRRAGIDCVGPLPADTLFSKALAWPDARHPSNLSLARPSHFDLVVAMYHDQGLAPLKMLAWDRAVNMTVGLSWQGRSIIRTSPDHGTAFDIAGTGRANAGSMKAAMRVALGGT